MTKREFEENIQSFGELLSFCAEYDCDACMDILNREQFNDAVDEDLLDSVRYCDWHDVRDILRGIQEHSETGYYYRIDALEYKPLTEHDFLSIKAQVASSMDENELWDDEEESAREEQESTEQEDFSVSDLINMCSVQYLSTQTNANMPRILK